MRKELEHHLADIREAGLSFDDDDAHGATANLRCISWPGTVVASASDFVQFLSEASSIRAELAIARAVSPTTFYVWFDEMAGQLRFSTARCTPDKLPFSASVVLIDDLRMIVNDFLHSSTRDGISWSELATSSAHADERDQQSLDPVLQVWARQLT